MFFPTMFSHEILDLTTYVDAGFGADDDSDKANDDDDNDNCDENDDDDF